ncbi:MAG: Y-family DNA polymerase [Ktedonobacteraceae bacterium]
MGRCHVLHSSPVRQKIVALVDCNNFYVSCERVFHAALQKKPVVVLSNNDGCIVARSNEAKKLGIKMGQPVFQCQDIIRKHHVQVFSSNYSLYADMSARVMKVLAQFTSQLEVYSIDEAFLDLTDCTHENLTELGHEIRASVLQRTGIPVSVGIASSKSLAKIATETAKKQAASEGVVNLCGLTEQDIDAYLAAIPIEDVWGIGRKYALFLNNYGIATARDLKYADAKWVRRHLTVVGERLVFELRGTACLPIESEPKSKKGIMCSKTFGREISNFQQLQEAIATYTARAAEKLRGQETQATALSVFVQTNRFNTAIPYYTNSYDIALPYPTSFTPDLIQYALTGLKAIYREGYRYKKAGVYLTKIVPEEHIQPDLFGEFSLLDHYRQARLMFILDALNTIYGRDALFFAIQGVTRPWKMHQSKLSGRFTTQWSEILSL